MLLVEQNAALALQLADHAPQAAVRDLARRQLDVLFAEWAQAQVGGYPAGPKSRTNGNWALSAGSSPWAAWAWLAAGIGAHTSIATPPLQERASIIAA